MDDIEELKKLGVKLQLAADELDKTIKKIVTPYMIMQSKWTVYNKYVMKYIAKLTELNNKKEKEISIEK